MFEIDFQIDISAPEKALLNAERQLQRNIDRFLDEAGDRVEAGVKGLMPVFSNEAKDSIVQEHGRGEESFVRVYSNLDDQMKMLTIEKSRRPGTRPPPASALLPWVQRKWGGDLLDAINLAQKIARDGSHNHPDGHQPFGKTAEKELPLIAAMADRIVDVF